jgi:hypothetical protein
LWLVGVLDSALLVFRGLGAFDTRANGLARVGNDWLESVLILHKRLIVSIGFRTKKGPQLSLEAFCSCAEGASAAPQVPGA